MCPKKNYVFHRYELYFNQPRQKLVFATGTHHATLHQGESFSFLLYSSRKKDVPLGQLLSKNRWFVEQAYGNMFSRSLQFWSLQIWDQLVFPEYFPKTSILSFSYAHITRHNNRLAWVSLGPCVAWGISIKKVPVLNVKKLSWDSSLKIISILSCRSRLCHLGSRHASDTARYLIYWFLLWHRFPFALKHIKTDIRK